MSDEHRDIATQVEQTLAKMSLEQKCALLSGETPFGTMAFPKLGVPSLEFSDGPTGLRHQAEGANHLGIGGSLPATCFPTAVTVANSWDADLGEQMGAALGEEAKVQGVNDLLGPGLCIKRNPLCGRNFEYFSEDPLLSGKMAAGFVRGVQTQGVSACPKHFAVNSQETRRQASDSVLDERTLREIYLAGFETVVREAKPQTIMSSYNLVNGTYANENGFLLNQILRKEWGFDGAVVTDWGGSVDHCAGVSAGSTFEMPVPGLDSVRELVDAVNAGKVSVEDVDARTREALTLILSTDVAVREAADTFNIDAHHELAGRVAAEGIVLLKNDAVDGTPALPLAKGTRVGLIGDFAQTPRYQGAGSSQVNCTKLENLLDLVKESDELELVGFEAGFERMGAANESMAADAVALAGKVDVAVVCLGLGEVDETEGADRRHMDLNANQTELLAAVRKACGHVVVLLSAGSAVGTDWTTDCDALLYLALGGQAGAGAALKALTGAVNPSGHLAESWPKKLADVPNADLFPSDKATAEYREGIFVGYRYFQTAQVPVAFPFGYGLSYTSFEYKDASLVTGADGAPAGVKLTVTNTGSVAGAEVCQLYVAKPEHTVFRAASELKGFTRVELAAGESKQVTIDLVDSAFKYYDVKAGSWQVEGGTYELRCGSSCEDIRATVSVEVAGTGAANPYEGLTLPAYESGKVQGVDDKQFAALLGKPIPDPKVTISREMCFRDLKHGRSPIFWIVGAVLTHMHNKNFDSGQPNLNVEFIYNMPLHAVAKMAPPVSMGVVDGLVMELKGFWIIGLLRALVALIANPIRNAAFKKKLS